MLSALMQRWFLSYHSPDQMLAERLKAAIERKDSALRVFFAPTRVLRGGSWINPPRSLRSALRYWDSTGDRTNSLSMRVGRALLSP